MAPMPHGCAIENYFRTRIDCALFGGMLLPIDKACRECPGWITTTAARDELAPGQDLRMFVQSGRVKPNAFVLNRKMEVISPWL